MKLPPTAFFYRCLHDSIDIHTLHYKYNRKIFESKHFISTSSKHREEVERKKNGIVAVIIYVLQNLPNACYEFIYFRSCLYLKVSL